ncbi:MAG: hypothetical protein WAO21_11270 [Verrucomicrobiia bacterium]
MSNRFDDRRPTELEDKAHTEAVRHFAEHFKQFPASREAVERLEKNAAKIALAANMAASQTSRRNPVQTDGGQQWHKCVDLMDNICLCHRPITGGAEYAVVEHFPARGINKIWNRSQNAVELLSLFAQEQRQALEIWTGDMRAQVKEFLAEKYPGQDMNRVADSFMHRFKHAVSQQQTQSHEQNHSRGIRI